MELRGHSDHGLAAVEGDDVTLSVPTDEVDRNGKIFQSGDTLARHRTRHDITPNHDSVDAFGLDLTQDRLQSGEVAMDVVDRGYPHL